MIKALFNVMKNIQLRISAIYSLLCHTVKFTAIIAMRFLFTQSRISKKDSNPKENWTFAFTLFESEQYIFPGTKERSERFEVLFVLCVFVCVCLPSIVQTNKEFFTPVKFPAFFCVLHNAVNYAQD